MRLPLARFAGKNPLLLFFALAYAIAWLVMWPLVLFRGPMELVSLATFGPSVALLPRS